MAFDRTYDTKVRAAAFEWLSRRVSMHGEVQLAVPRRPAEQPSVELLAKRYDRFLEVAAAI